MMSILRRNMEWQSEHRELLRKKPNPREELSEKAEIRASDSIRRLGGEYWEIYHRVRVPMLDTIRGKGEIDIIAVGRRCVLAVEVKNWIGLIEEKDGEFFQKGVPRGRVLERHSEKVSSLERMYRSETNSNVPPIFSVVLFPNPRTRLSEGVSRMFSCLMLEDLDSFYQTTIAPHDEISTQTRSDLSRMFEDFGTWDTIEYHGGLILPGDVADGFSICPHGEQQEDRRSISEVSFRSTRGPLSTIIFGPRVEARVKFRDGRSTVWEADPFRKLEFFPAGSPKVSLYPSRIKEVSFGHVGLEGWRKERNRGASERTSDSRISRYSLGDVVVGTVDSWSESGIVVELDKSGCIGLLHNRSFSTFSEMEISRSFYSKGKEIEVEVGSKNNNELMLHFPAGQ